MNVIKCCLVKFLLKCVLFLVFEKVLCVGVNLFVKFDGIFYDTL